MAACGANTAAFLVSKEYLTTCQQRIKWKTDNSSQLKVGQLVMMREDDVMPWTWTLARVLEVHQEKDGVVRTVTLRTAKGDYKRPIVKLAPIPCENVIE